MEKEFVEVDLNSSNIDGEDERDVAVEDNDPLDDLLYQTSEIGARPIMNL